MRTYRDKFDIIADILEIAKSKPKKTQIMYQANLSYSVLKKYLAEIIDNGLVSYKADSRYYMLTEKGRELLFRYEEYSNANKLVQKELKLARLKKESLEELCNSKNYNCVTFTKTKNQKIEK